MQAERYLQELAVKGYSKNTIDTYRQALKPLMDMDRGYAAITTMDIMRILAVNKDLKTVASRQSAIKGFFKWLYETGQIKSNPATNLGSVRKKPPKQVPPMTSSDRELILVEINKLPLAPRVLFLLIAHTDISIYEALALEVENISDNYILAGEKIIKINSNAEYAYLLESLCKQQGKGSLFTNERGEQAPYLWAYYLWRRTMKQLNQKGIRKYSIKQLRPSSGPAQPLSEAFFK